MLSLPTLTNTGVNDKNKLNRAVKIQLATYCEVTKFLQFSHSVSEEKFYYDNL